MANFDIKKWLIEEMKFSADDAEKMLPSFTAERTAILANSYKSSAELEADRKAIAKAQADYAAANEALNKEMAEWATLTAGEKASATEQRNQLEAARVRATQLETRLTALATEHGVDPKALLEGTAVIPEKTVVTPPALDPNQFVSREAYNSLASYQLQLPAKLQRIEREHLQLTGEHLDTEAITAEIIKRAGKKDAVIDPVAIWEEQHGIPAKREAKRLADHNAEIKAAEDRGEERARTNMAVPGPATPGRHAPVFARIGADGQVQPRTSVLKRPQPEAGVRAAANAFATGKYRNKPA